MITSTLFQLQAERVLAATTIKDYILENEIKNVSERLEKLKDIRAPQVMLDGLAKELQELRKGNFKITGDKELLNYKWKTREIKKGRGGKVFIQFDGKINYFPTAKYGKYITVVNG